jgi:hypothetical protein
MWDNGESSMEWIRAHHNSLVNGNFGALMGVGSHEPNDHHLGIWWKELFLGM